MESALGAKRPKGASHRKRRLSQKKLLLFWLEPNCAFVAVSRSPGVGQYTYITWTDRNCNYTPSCCVAASVCSAGPRSINHFHCCSVSDRQPEDKWRVTRFHVEVDEVFVRQSHPVSDLIVTTYRTKNPFLSHVQFDHHCFPVLSRGLTLQLTLPSCQPLSSIKVDVWIHLICLWPIFKANGAVQHWCTSCTCVCAALQQKHSAVCELFYNTQRFGLSRPSGRSTGAVTVSAVCF